MINNWNIKRLKQGIKEVGVYKTFYYTFFPISYFNKQLLFMIPQGWLFRRSLNKVKGD